MTYGKGVIREFQSELWALILRDEARRHQKSDLEEVPVRETLNQLVSLARFIAPSDL